MQTLVGHSVSGYFLICIFSQLSFTFSQRFNERRVTDLELIESPYGVPLDFSYNQTSSGFGRLNSVPGCPKSIDGYPWVYYGNPPRCYLSGYKGPCSYDRLLFLELGSTQGVCGCECFQYTSMSDIVRSPDGRFRFCNWNSEQVQDSQDKFCYDLEQRGPCEKHQWLVKDRTGLSVMCTPKCPDSPTGILKYDHWTGACFFPTTSAGAGAGAAGGAGNIIPNHCPHQNGVQFKFSHILKKCIPVRNHPGDYVFIG